MAMRSHLFRPVMDATGALMYGATVTVRQANVSIELDQTLWTAPTGTDALPNPFVIGNGYVDIWLDTPERVNLLIQVDGHPDISIFLDAQPAPADLVRALEGFTITNAGTAGQLLTAQSDGTAAWAAAPTVSGPVPAHNHDGAGSESVALGTSASATGAQATTVGDASQATATLASAFGYSAVASGIQAVAAGSNAHATAEGSIAVGYQSVASGFKAIAIGATAQALGDYGVAVGFNSTVNGTTAAAVGPNSVAAGFQAVAIGYGAQAQESGAMALGTGAVVAVGHTNSVALGAGAATTAANQIMLGTASYVVLIPGSLTTYGDVVLGGAANKVGFYGSAGAVKTTVTGSRGGNAGLATLLTYLASLGLITDGTTA